MDNRKLTLKNISEQENHHEEVGRGEPLRPSRLVHLFGSFDDVPPAMTCERIVFGYFVVAVCLHVHLVVVMIVVQAVSIVTVDVSFV